MIYYELVQEFLSFGSLLIWYMYYEKLLVTRNVKKELKLSFID